MVWLDIMDMTSTGDIYSLVVRIRNVSNAVSSLEVPCFLGQVASLVRRLELNWDAWFSKT
jgi:hypothetical protein